jgi:hypothetical protein
MRPDRPDAAAAPEEGATVKTNAPEGQRKLTAGGEVEAARDVADRAKRLALRAAGKGYVDCDDLLDLVSATGRLCDLMVGGAR